MLWKTHIRISNEVLRRLGITLSYDVYERFKEGVLAPDHWKDYPHHYGKSDAIERNLLHARQFYLQNNLQDAFYYLGVALHYIQDSYTSVISYDSPNNLIWHQNYEQSIEDSKFDYNLENTIKYFFTNDYHQLNKYSEIANSLSEKIIGKDDTLRAATLVGRSPSNQTGKPKIDLNLALKACFVVTESVLSSRTNTQLDLSLKQSLNYHENLMHDAELVVSTKIIEMAKQVQNLESKRITKSGTVSKLKNWLISLRVEIKNLQLNSKYNKYLQKKHLIKVSSKYKQATDNLINPHVGWYNFSISELNFSTVKNQLIPIQEVSKYFMVSEQTIRDT